MSGNRNRPRRLPVGGVIVILALIGIAVIWGGQISSSVGTLVSGALDPSGRDSARVTAEDLETGQKTINYPYVLRGRSGLIRFDTYRGVNDYLSTKYPASFADERDYWLQFTDESIQDRYLRQLADNIRAAETDREDQARAAISMVQKIPYIGYSYDTAAKYPYHVLYHQNGDCDEKSLLLAYLLRDLGYGVAVFEFEQESHMAVGVRAPERYCYGKTGYAFIETTVPTIPTDAGGEYGEAEVKLKSDPKVFVVADGDSFEGIWREHTDAAEWNRIRSMGRELDPYNYGRYRNLAQAYGIPYE
ncbi:transglutaminase domain-containing protein [Methanoculleus sp.]|jgi:hypothetical protein|uniref:transglutaminase domain-containing protein n=1 Tax=Methanoculleus sp. TaxID=90427 RepID=UPI0025F6EBAE|nr:MULTISPECIES: transglutaminase domain-containing protein [Methanoculleus]